MILHVRLEQCGMFLDRIVKSRRWAEVVSGWYFTRNKRLATSDIFLSSSDQLTATSERFPDAGFTLLPILGILAIMTITLSVLLPNMPALYDQETTTAERKSLEEIGKGTQLHLKTNRSWPANLAAHAPNYVSVDSANLSQNPNGFPRYYFAHPTMVGFSNGAGVASSALADAKFLLISNLKADAAPTITNSTEFDAWWGTAETANLHIHKGNVARLFSQVTLSGSGKGGSFQIDGTSTNSNGGTLPNYGQYHVKGTMVSLDEANTYGTPEIQLALTGDVTFTYVSCFPSGQRWRVPPVPPCPVLWISTSGNASGTPGITWKDNEIVSFVTPDLTYETGPTGQTSGTFANVMDLEDFANSADIDAAHYVSTTMVVGGFNLQEGDLLLSTESSETLTSNNSLSVSDEDVFVFRPASFSNYSSGSFYMLIDGSDVFSDGDSDLRIGDVQAVTLVESDIAVGGVNLLQGDFLVAGEDRIVVRFRPTTLGASTSGTRSIFIDGGEINISEDFDGIELIETETEIGDITLQPGQILATIEPSGFDIGDNEITAYQTNIFILDLTVAGANTEGDATIVFDGFDVGMSSTSENVDAIALNGGGSNLNTVALTITNADFETGDLTGWTKTSDLLETGGTNQWGAVTSAAAMSSPYEGSYFAGGRATGAIGSGEHITGIYQRIDVSGYTTEIDAGTATVSITGFGHGETSQDQAYLRIAYYDAVSGGNQLGSNVDSNYAIQSQTWTSLSISGNSMPVGTRSIQLFLLGYKVSAGSYLDAGVDDVSATLSYP